MYYSLSAGDKDPNLDTTPPLQSNPACIKSHSPCQSDLNSQVLYTILSKTILKLLANLIAVGRLEGCYPVTPASMKGKKSFNEKCRAFEHQDVQ